MSLISIQEAAERLRVRPDYIHELVRKQRLTFGPDQRLDSTQVDQLALLMNKLRHQGIATLVNIVEEGGNPHA